MIQIEDIEKLLNTSYFELVQMLLEKYGNVTDNYYSEKSYNRFLNGEIKSITRGHFSRTNDGLVTHHILENKFQNIGDWYFIKKNNYSFEYQKKQNLVYCNLIEHAILHYLIVKETLGLFGGGGLDVYLRSQIYEWYVLGRLPSREWQKIEFTNSFIDKTTAEYLLSKISKLLISINNLPKEAKKEKSFELNYQTLFKAGISYNISRERLLKKLYKIEHPTQIEFYEYKSAHIDNYKDELLTKLENLMRSTLS